VVIASGKQKIDNDPEGIVALLRAINRGLEFLKKSREKVAEAVISKNTFGDPAMVRRVINQFADLYSTSISRQDIDALIHATRIEAEAKKLGGPDKFFTREFLAKAIGQSR
jgi:ABC-type nitrate/sulfonate/bicarbonate transport system substrate-binding protein